jgi:hypothetical protein
MKWILIIGGGAGAVWYLKTQRNIDLSTGDGWSALAQMFGAKPCGCKQAAGTPTVAP